eukprot:TRINITY_DN6371_c0_g1_i3.p1 TRINITY_DN6371_c0_g1~~TRINITY_DN6371_c0_g1_i3.p1  ORF type:complete len:615 (+),score=98.56 TRINITY_DN6371_c0_g1_i3:65-1909(+)
MHRSAGVRSAPAFDGGKTTRAAGRKLFCDTLSADRNASFTLPRRPSTASAQLVATLAAPAGEALSSAKRLGRQRPVSAAATPVSLNSGKLVVLPTSVLAASGSRPASASSRPGASILQRRGRGPLSPAALSRPMSAPNLANASSEDGWLRAADATPCTLGVTETSRCKNLQVDDFSRKLADCSASGGRTAAGSGVATQPAPQPTPALGSEGDDNNISQVLQTLSEQLVEDIENFESHLADCTKSIRLEHMKDAAMAREDERERRRAEERRRQTERERKRRQLLKEAQNPHRRVEARIEQHREVGNPDIDEKVPLRKPAERSRGEGCVMEMESVDIDELQRRCLALNRRGVSSLQKVETASQQQRLCEAWESHAFPDGCKPDFVQLNASAKLSDTCLSERLTRLRQQRRIREGRTRHARDQRHLWHEALYQRACDYAELQRSGGRIRSRRMTDCSSAPTLPDDVQPLTVDDIEQGDSSAFSTEDPASPTMERETTEEPPTECSNGSPGPLPASPASRPSDAPRRASVSSIADVDVQPTLQQQYRSGSKRRSSKAILRTHFVRRRSKIIAVEDIPPPRSRAAALWTALRSHAFFILMYQKIRCRRLLGGDAARLQN